jgi:hypothetical protein
VRLWSIAGASTWTQGPPELAGRNALAHAMEDAVVAFHRMWSIAVSNGQRQKIRPTITNGN